MISTIRRVDLEALDERGLLSGSFQPILAYLLPLLLKLRSGDPAEEGKQVLQVDPSPLLTPLGSLIRLGRSEPCWRL